MLTITKKQSEKISKRFKYALKAGLIEDYKDAASVLHRILWDVVPEIANKMPSGDSAPRSFHRAYDEIKVV